MIDPAATLASKTFLNMSTPKSIDKLTLRQQLEKMQGQHAEMSQSTDQNFIFHVVMNMIPANLGRTFDQDTWLEPEFACAIKNAQPTYYACTIFPSSTVPRATVLEIVPYLRTLACSRSRR